MRSCDVTSVSEAKSCFQNIRRLSRSTMTASDSPNVAGLAASSAPAWFEAALKPIHDRLEHIEVRLRNIEARQLNAIALEQGDPLVVLLNGAGEVPPHFPATRRDVHDLSNTTVKALLTHYHQPVPHDPIHRRQRLKQFIGIRN